MNTRLDKDTRCLQYDMMVVIIRFVFNHMYSYSHSSNQVNTRLDKDTQLLQYDMMVVIIRFVFTHTAIAIALTNVNVRARYRYRVLYDIMVVIIRLVFTYKPITIALNTCLPGLDKDKWCLLYNMMVGHYKIGCSIINIQP